MDLVEVADEWNEKKCKSSFVSNLIDLTYDASQKRLSYGESLRFNCFTPG